MYYGTDGRLAFAGCGFIGTYAFGEINTTTERECKDDRQEGFEHTAELLAFNL